MTATGIDLNCDMGELWPLQTDGTQARLVRAVSSVNIACGAHAGDEALIAATVRLAREAGLAIGAHPGYPDRST
jgi:5-oxoprolinase (ATP-hydrolysing) subunit A